MSDETPVPSWCAGLWPARPRIDPLKELANRDVAGRRPAHHEDAVASKDDSPIHPSAASSDRTRLARAMKIAALLVFLAAGYVRNQRPGWNVHSQIALVYAIVERGTLSIDAYHDDPATATGDKAFHGGRFYCDKSPVTSFLGVPVYWAARETVRALAGGYGHALERERGWARYVTTWGTIGGCAAGLAALLTLMLARAGVPPERAGVVAALWFAATPLLGYSILFFNYVPACAMALGGALLARSCAPDPSAAPRDPEGGRASAWRLLAGGFLLGLAAWTLQTLALLALILTVAMFLEHARAILQAEPKGEGPSVDSQRSPTAERVRSGVRRLAAAFCRAIRAPFRMDQERTETSTDEIEPDGSRNSQQKAAASRRTPKQTRDPNRIPPSREPGAGGLLVAILRSSLALLPWAIGGVLGASGYAIYSLAIFGRVASPYEFEFDPHFREGMAQGLMGAGLPRLDVLFLILVHPFRGLFTLFPGTLLAFVGACLVVARRGTSPHSWRAETAVGLAFLAGLVLYNAGYYMWWGGWAYAPRHLIPALPLLALGLVPFVRPKARAGYFATVALLAAGAVVNLAVVSLDPQPPPGLPESVLLDPERFLRWRSPFLEVLRYVLRGQTDPNWGTALGLRGVWSLAPLVAIWAAGLWMLCRRRA